MLAMKMLRKRRESKAATQISDDSPDQQGTTGSDKLDALETYQVIYKGGHPDYPKAKAGAIKLGLHPEEFVLESTRGTQRWFRGITIPYDQVRNVEIVARNVSTVEGVLGGLNSRQLNQDNNIHITYNAGGQEIVLRLEMLTGVSVMGQAAKCREFKDRLRTLGILDKFQTSGTADSSSKPTSDTEDVLDQISKMAALKDQGILSEEEFQAKKADLLSRM